MRVETVRRYSFSALMVFGATILLWLLRDILTSANYPPVFLVVVLISAIYEGTGPSLFVAVTSFLCVNFFLVKPYYTFLVADPRDLLDLGIYLGSAALTGQLASFARNQERNAAQRADELNTLYEVATTFNQLVDAAAVYQTLTRILRERLTVQSAEVSPSTNTLSPAPASSHTLALLLRSGEHGYGTLSATFAEAPSALTVRLITACATQAAIALQRIDLTQRAQRSKNFEEADRLKTALLHAVSHDLRTPITIIKTSANNLSRLDQTLPEPERHEIFRVIEGEADHLDKMVGNLLDVSRLKAGAMQINSALNSLEEVAGDVAARAWNRIHEERIKINFPDDYPLVCFDYGLILQVLTNLVENSLRYEPPTSQVKITGFLKPGFACVAVIGHGGPAIPPEERDLIMEPFYHGPGGNTGLGLAIAKGIVEAHQGKLQVEDTPGGGATFVFALPFIAQGADHEDSSCR